MSFKDIKGQDRALQILKGYLKSSNLQGAYLFIGQEGIGKQLVARNFTKAINCLEKKEDSCDTCRSCTAIDKDQHPDMHFINAGSLEAIKIESIRALKKEIAFKPYYEVKKKVFMINNAHNLTAEASNALLKILEEPPPDSIIILITAKPALLFKTIVSRCKIIRFHPLRRRELEGLLKKDYALHNHLAHFLAYFCEGRIGRALKLKETDILTEKNRIIDEFALCARPNSEKLSPETRADLRHSLNILAGWFRDMYLVKIGLAHAELINLDRKSEILKAMHRYTLFDLDEIIKCLANSLLFLEQNINLKLLLSNLRAELWKR